MSAPLEPRPCPCCHGSGVLWAMPAPTAVPWWHWGLAPAPPPTQVYVSLSIDGRPVEQTVTRVIGYRTEPRT